MTSKLKGAKTIMMGRIKAFGFLIFLALLVLPAIAGLSLALGAFMFVNAFVSLISPSASDYVLEWLPINIEKLEVGDYE
jgi:hypothetical protein